MSINIFFFASFFLKEDNFCQLRFLFSQQSSMNTKIYNFYKTCLPSYSLVIFSTSIAFLYGIGPGADLGFSRGRGGLENFFDLFSG